jgi:peptide/nickel transport system substrate-binding protein
VAQINRTLRASRGTASRRAVIVAVTVGLLAAACGGGGSGKKSTAAPSDASTTSTTAATESTSSTDAAAVPSTTSTSAAAAKASTGTTAKKTTATTAKTVKGSQTVGVANTVKGGISNITAAPSTAARSDITPGGTLTLYLTGDIQNLDPITMQNSGSTDAPPGSLVFDMLMYTDLKTSTVVPKTAESLTSTDALVWTLKLRPNIKFTDGTPYDAAAVKFNWQRLQDPKNAAARASQANTMASMDVIDPLTLKITLKTKNAVFPGVVALIPFIGSPTAFQQKGAGFGNDPVGAGPFILKQWVRDSQKTLVRNPNYWDAPRPYVDQVLIKLIFDTSQRMNTFFTSPGANLMYINTANDAKSATDRGAIPNTATLNGGTVIYFNLRKPPFNDIRARQAFTMAIDRNDLIKTLDSGLIPPMDSVFRHESPFYDPSITQIGYDPAKAQQLFDQLAQETGGPMNITLYTFGSGNYPIAAQYIQATLNKMRNVKVSIDQAATATQVSRTTNGDFTVSNYGNPFDDPDPVWVGLFTCSGQSQYTGFCNAQYDADVDKQRTALDPKERVAALKDAQKIFYQQIPAWYYELRTNWVFSTPSVQDFAFANDGLELMDRMWIKQ